MNYACLDVHVAPAVEGYRAWVDARFGGRAMVDLRAPVGEVELEDLRALIDQSGSDAQSCATFSEPSGLDTLKAVGSRLFGAVFKDRALGCLMSSLDEATRQG